RAAAAYQQREVIPHCTRCLEPCCKLQRLVLDLNWKQVKQFWKLDVSRGEFDRQLAAGQGPEAIRAGNGRYYAHRQPCPAYDPVRPGCTVYDQPIKPPGCSDFPVYADGDGVLADLRCEAVNLEALLAELRQALGPGFRLIQRPNPDFPFLVTLIPQRPASKPPGRRPAPAAERGKPLQRAQRGRR
ncbi:MAG: hypothetical protein RIR00_946, partial [Pseudomonadota bacterium]